MADIQANIGIGVDTSQALAAIRQLQREISAFHTSMAKGGALASANSARLSQNLVNTINATGQFSAGMTRIQSGTESFTTALEKNKLSMSQYFRFAGGASRSFGKMFSREFSTINQVATERVKDLQTQYISMGRDANGALQAIKVRPLALDMDNLGTRVQMVAQKQQLFNQLLKQGSTNLLNFGKNTQWAGRQLMVGFTIPLTIFGGLAIKEFQKIEEQVVKFRRVYGDMFNTDAETEQALSNIRELAEEFTKYGIAVEKTIGLAAKVAQMGNVGTDLTEQVTQATRLAVLGGLEQEEALDTTISLTNAFGIAAEDLAGKIAFLNAAENQTILAIEDFNTAIPLSGSVVRQLGGDVEDLAVLLTAMREGGINASQAGNALKSSLGRLIAPSRNAKNVLGGFGIDVMGIVEQNAGNLMGTINTLAVSLNELDPLSRARSIEALFGKFQFARMSTLFSNIIRDGSQANKVLGLTTATTEELAVIANRELSKVEQSPAFKLQKQMEALKASLAPIGEEFVKAIGPLIEFGTRLLKSFNNLGAGGKQFIVILTALAGVVAPAVLMVVGLVANGIANLIKFVALLGRGFARLSGSSRILGTGTEYMTQQQIEAAAVAASLGQSHSNLIQVFTAEAAAVRNLAAAYRQAIAAQSGFRGGAAGVGGRSTGPAPKKYNKGVTMVPGPKGAGDIVPAMLSPGEAVIPAEQAQKYSGFIKNIISDNVPGYITGKLPEAGPQATKIASALAVPGTSDSATGSIAKNIQREIESSARALGLTLEQAGDRLATALESVTGQVSRVQELKESPQFVEARQERIGIAEAGKTQAAHIGISGVKTTVSSASEQAPGQSWLAAAAKVDPDAQIDAKHSWTRQLSTKANREMGMSSGTSGANLLEEMRSKSPEAQAEAWSEGFEATGTEMTAEVQSELVAFDNKIQELLAKRLEENANTMVFDTEAQIQALPEADRANAVSIEQLEGQAAAETLANTTTGNVRTQARDTVREFRFDTSKDFRAKVASDLALPPEQRRLSEQEHESLAPVLRKGGRDFNLAKKDRADSSIAALDPVSEARETGAAAGQGFIDGAEAALQIASPSKRMFGIGKNAADSLADGFEQGMADETGKPPLPGNLAAPPPPTPPPVVPPSRGTRLKNAILDSGPSKFLGKKLAQQSGVAITDTKGEVFYDPNEDMSTWAGQATAKDKEFRASLPGGEGYTPDLPDIAGGAPLPVRVVDGFEMDPQFQETMESGQAQTGDLSETLSKNVQTTEDNTKTAKEVAKTDKRQRRMALAGKAMGGLGSLTMAAGMATQAPGVIGETAQKLVGPLGALTAALPMLIGLGPIFGTLALVIGAGVAAWMLYNNKLKEVTENARKLAENLGSGSKAMGVFAEAAGKATPTEIMNERRQLGGINVALGKSEFGEQFVASDEGQEYIETIKTGFEEIGREKTMEKLGNQLATAVASNILTPEEAAGIAAELGRSMGDLSISMDILGNMTALIGPGGENLLTDPLEVFVNLVQATGEDVGQTIQEMMNNIVAPDVGTGFFEGLFTGPELQAQLAGEVIAAGQQVQAVLDAQTVGHEKKMQEYKDENALIQEQINQLTAQGRIEEANAKQGDLDTNNAAILDLENKYWSERTSLLAEARNQNSQLLEQESKISDLSSRAGLANAFAGTEGEDEVRGILKEFEELTGTSFDFDIDSADANKLGAALRDVRKESIDIEKSFQGTLDQMGEVVISGLDENDPNIQRIRNLTTDQEVDYEVRFNLIQGVATGATDMAQVEKFLNDFPVKAKQIKNDADLIADTRNKLITSATNDAARDFYATLSDEDIIARIISDNQRVQKSFADIGLALGQGANQQLMNIFGGIDDVGLQEDITTKISLLVEGGEEEDLQRAEEMLETFSTIASYGDMTGIDREASINFFLNNPEAFDKFRGQLEEFDSLEEEYGEDLTHEVVLSAIFEEDSDGYNAFKGQEEYFNSLPQNQKKLFLSTFVTQFLTVGSMEGTPEGDEAFSSFKSEQLASGASTIRQLRDMTYDDFVAFTAVEAAKKVTAAMKAAGLIDDLEVDPPDGGGGAEPQIDSLLKKLRDLRDGTIEMKKGWEGMQQVLDSIFAGGAKELNIFDGLEKQLRELNLGENLIAQIVGMDPDEFEKRKNELFKMDGKRIVGATDALTNMNKAFDAVAIGEYVNGQEKFIQKTNNQFTAITTLTGAGLTLAEAYEAVQDEALAAAIAQGGTADQIAKIVELTKKVTELKKKDAREQERIRIAEAVQKTNEEFEKRVQIYQKLSKELKNYTDAQIDAILNDSNIGSIFLDPSIDSGALTKALADAERKADLELKIRKLTVEGTRGIFEEGFGQAMDAFGRQEQAIELKFKAETSGDDEILRQADEDIAAIQYKLDDYNAELERISWQEEEINDAYEKRFEALDSIADANERIAKAQESQLDIADALSKGDIAAAARAVASLRSQQAQDASKNQREMLEDAQKTQIEGLRSASGLSREEIEDRSQQLERQIFNIEEINKRPAQERIRLATSIRDAEVAALTVLEKTREEWDGIKSGIDMAEASGWKFKETMQEALNVVEKLMKAYPTEKPKPPPPPPPPPAQSAPRQSSPELGQPGKGGWEVSPGVSLIAKAASVGMHWTEYYNQKRGGPGGLDATLVRKAGGGMIIPKRMAMGGLASRSRSGPPLQMAMGGRVKGYPMGGLIPYKSDGGFFKSLGSDTIPAMLTPGEFVIRRPAVRGFGVDNLEKINRGTYNDGSVYNYNLAVNVKSDSDPNRIARAVITNIKSIENQRIRSNRL